MTYLNMAKELKESLKAGSSVGNDMRLPPLSCSHATDATMEKP